MTSAVLTQPGTDVERGLLLQAIERHCTCPRRADGARLDACGAHRLLVDPQAARRLMYAHRMAERLQQEELRA